MTSRQKRFRKKQAEEVRKALAGYPKCEDCGNYFEPWTDDMDIFKGLCASCWGVKMDKIINPVIDKALTKIRGKTRV